MEQIKNTSKKINSKISQILLLFIASFFLFIRINSLFFPLSDIVILVLLIIVYIRSDNKNNKAKTSLILSIISVCISYLFSIIIIINSGGKVFNLGFDLYNKLKEVENTEFYMYIDDIKLLGDTLKNYATLALISELLCLLLSTISLTIMAINEAVDDNYKKKFKKYCIITSILLVIFNILLIFTTNSYISLLTQCWTGDANNPLTTDFIIYLAGAIIFSLLTIIPYIVHLVYSIIYTVSIKKSENLNVIN